MFHAIELGSMLAFLGVFVGTSCLVLAVFYWLQGGDRRRAVARLRELSPDDEPTTLGFGEWMRAAVMRLGAWLVPGHEKRRAALLLRFTHAGIYTAHAPRLFLGVQLVLTIALPILWALVPFLCGFVTLRVAVVVSLVVSGAGLLLPSFWLDARTRKRQAALRCGLPDALDMLVLCLEGGISLAAAFQRVTSELWSAHPLLAAEMTIALREMQMGLSAGEALKKLADRCKLDEVRDLANVLLQSERFGGSTAKSLRAYAESWRQERQQHLEERARRAAVKILFPTLLCIFPAVFIVTLGPAAYQITAMFARPK